MFNHGIQIVATNILIFSNNNKTAEATIATFLFSFANSININNKLTVSKMR